MTKVCLEHMSVFLNYFAREWTAETRVGDFGGSTKVGGDTVRDALASGGLRNFHVVDLDTGHDLMRPYRGQKFDLGLCMNLLEHVPNPFTVAKNVREALNPGSLLFVSVPWVWELHDFPRDYWRICPDGLVELFKPMESVTTYLVRDQADDEQVQRQRLFGVFRSLRQAPIKFQVKKSAVK